MLLASCASRGLRVDRFPSPLDTNYYAAELIIDGNHHYGVAAAKADRSRPFSFSVVGVHRGTISVRSAECKFYASKSYTEDATVEFLIPMGGDRCLYEVFVVPTFDDPKIEWRALAGVLMLRRTNHDAIVQAVQIREDDPYKFQIDLPSESRVVLRGCGFLFDQVLKGKVTIPIEYEYDFFNHVCVVDGLAKSGDGERTVIALFLSLYSKDFTRLSMPELKFKGSKMEVNAENSVSYMSYRGESAFGNTFTFRRSHFGWLRLYTAQGRYEYCRLTDTEAKCFY